MAFNTWWDGDPEQRYWMEVVTTDSIGVLLQSPKQDETKWSYDLVSLVRPGDRVLHWRTTGGKRLMIGWSQVIGEAGTVAQYTWQPRGTAGRALGAPRTTPGWVAPLGGLRKFRNPPDSAEVQRYRSEIVDLSERLMRSHGKPTYFPFYLYGGSQIRAQQGYLMKFPKELFDVLPGLDAARVATSAGSAPEPKPDDADDLPEDGQPGRSVPKGRTTRAQDPALRAAIERRSLDVALEYYESIGGTDAQELGKPFDIVVTVDDIERHCEVKGSSVGPDTYELTVNEIHHARHCPASDLIVVDNIEIYRNMATGEITATGGTIRVWHDWVPDESALVAKKFAYTLPPSN